MLDAQKLDALLDVLRRERFGVGVRERLVAHGLIAALTAQGIEAKADDRTRAMLSSLLARSPAEASRFKLLFRATFAFDETEKSDETQQRPFAHPKPDTVSSRPLLTIGRSGIAAVVILVPVVALAIAWQLFNRGPERSESPRPSTEATLPKPDNAVALERLEESATPILTVPTWFRYLPTGIPFLIIGFSFARRRRARAHYLHRRMPLSSPELIDLVVSLPRRVAAQMSQLHRAAQGLQARVSEESDRLDDEATVHATARAGGLFTPVAGQIRHPPDYLILVETRGAGDQEAERVDTLVKRLSDTGTAIERYFFIEDPRYCHGELAGPPITLERLASLKSENRLIIIGQGRGFLNSVTLEPQPFCKTLKDWPRRAMLTPVPLDEWGQPEFTLAKELELPLGRATSEGFLALPELLGLDGREERPLYRISAGGDGALAVPEILRTDAHRLIAPLPLFDDQCKVLADELKHFLGPEGYLWLSTLAIYPALQWDITLYLGVTLKDRNGEPLYSETRAAALTQLPWLRNGVMPDWLRRRLITGLPAETRAAAVAALWQLIRGIDNAFAAGEAVRLKIAGDRTGRGWSHSGQLPDQLQRDKVFIETLTDERIPDLAFALPEIEKRSPLAKLLRGASLELADIKMLFWGVALAAAAFWLAPLLSGAFLPLSALTLTGLLAWIAVRLPYASSPAGVSGAPKRKPSPRPKPRPAVDGKIHPNDGRRLRNLLFPFFNPRFALSIGVIYWLITWEFHTLVSRYEISSGKIDTLGMSTSLGSVLPFMPIYLIQAMIASISLIAILGSLYAVLIWSVDADETPGILRHLTKFFVGTAHFLAHLTAMFALSLLVVTWNNQMTPTIQSQLDALYTSRDEQTPIVRDAVKESLDPLKRLAENQQRAPREPLAPSPVRQLVGFISYPILMVTLGGLVGGLLWGFYWLLTGVYNSYRNRGTIYPTWERLIESANAWRRRLAMLDSVRGHTLSFRNLLFPFFNPGFALGIGVVYWVITWEFQTLVTRNEISSGKIDTLGMGTSFDEVLVFMPIYLIQTIISSYGLSTMLGGLYATLLWYVDAVDPPGFRRFATKAIVGTLHFLAHLAAMFTLSLLVVTWNNQMTPTIQSQLDALYTSREEQTPIVREVIKESLESLKRRTEQRQRMPQEATPSPVRELVGFMSYPILMITLGGLVGGLLWGFYWVLTGLYSFERGTQPNYPTWERAIASADAWRRRFTRARLKDRSYRLGLRQLVFPLFDPTFSLGIGIIYWLITWEFQTLVARNEISAGKIDTLGMGTSLWSVLPAMPIYLIQAIISSISLTAMLGGLHATLFWYVDAVDRPGFRRFATKFIVGTVHFLAHLTAMFTLSLLVVTWNNQMTPTIQSQLDALYTSREEQTPIVREVIKESLESLKRRTEQRQRMPQDAHAPSPVRQLVGFTSYPFLMITLGGLVGGLLWGFYGALAGLFSAELNYRSIQHRESTNYLLERRSSWSVILLVSLGIIVLAEVFIYALGHPLFCKCGYIKLWHGGRGDAEFSQHLTDWGTYVHAAHGVIIYFLLWVVARDRFSIASRLWIALTMEATLWISGNWILGNSEGSVLNSVGDMLAMVVGFVVASRLPALTTIGLLIAFEAGLMYLIRDSVMLNIIMIIYPLESIGQWQAGG